MAGGGDPKTKAFYAEMIGNPTIDVIDIEQLAALAHENGVPLIVDNTFASPYLCRPLEWGADIVVHSATKFICGHGTAIGGVIVDGGRFPWDNGKFPGMTEPSKGYHDLRFFEYFGDFGWLLKCRAEMLRDYGPTMAPFGLADADRARDPPGADGPARRQRSACGRVPGGARGRGVRRLPRPALQSLPRPGAQVPAEGRRLHLHLRSAAAARPAGG